MHQEMSSKGLAKYVFDSQIAWKNLNLSSFMTDRLVQSYEPIISSSGASNRNYLQNGQRYSLGF
jgi:hypothetical protein